MITLLTISIGVADLEAVEKSCCLTIWVTSCVLGLLRQSPYNTGSPDGFLFLEKSTCKIQVKHLGTFSAT